MSADRVSVDVSASTASVFRPGDVLNATWGDGITEGPFVVTSIVETTLNLRRLRWWERAWRWARTAPARVRLWRWRRAAGKCANGCNTLEPESRRKPSTP